MSLITCTILKQQGCGRALSRTQAPGLQHAHVQCGVRVLVLPHHGRTRVHIWPKLSCRACSVSLHSTGSCLAFYCGTHRLGFEELDWERVCT